MSEFRDCTEEITDWVKAEPESILFNKEGIEHIVKCIQSIKRWYYKGAPLGDFLTAVVKNDLKEACGRADNINRYALSLYVKYIYNYIPLDYREKARRL